MTTGTMTSSPTPCPPTTSILSGTLLVDDSVRLRVGGGGGGGDTSVTSVTTALPHHHQHHHHRLDPLSLEGSTNGIVDDCVSEELRDAITTTMPLPKLGVLPLAIIVFYSVSGGPFGVEPAVRSAGNLYALAGFALLPLLWSAPEALVTAELGAAIPQAAGGVAWVESAFGSTTAWLCGYLGWISGATDNAIYPVLFLDYVSATFGIGQEWNAVERWMFLAACSVTLAYINWLGLPMVGNMSMAICVLAMSPFVILCLIGAFHVNPSRWLELPPLPTSDQANDPGDTSFSWSSFATSFSRVSWAPFLNNLFWNGNSFDSCASFAADVENPAHAFPKALTASVVFVGLGYFVPLLVTLGASTASPNEWVDGYLAKAASDIAGPWLGGWTVFAAGISNIAMFQAELSADAFQLMGMAERGYLPAFFSIRSRHGTPTYGILTGTLVIILMALSDLEGLIEMLNFQYSISLLMEYAAFIQLRRTHADLPRPYRIPLNTLGCCLLFTLPVCMTLLVMALASWSTLAFSLAVNAFGLAMYHFFAKGRLKNSSSVISYEQVEVVPTAPSTGATA